MRELSNSLTSHWSRASHFFFVFSCLIAVAFEHITIFRYGYVSTQFMCLVEMYNCPHFYRERKEGESKNSERKSGPVVWRRSCFMRYKFMASFYSDLKKKKFIAELLQVISYYSMKYTSQYWNKYLFHLLCITPTVKNWQWYYKYFLVSSFVAKLINLSNYKCISRSELLQ